MMIASPTAASPAATVMMKIVKTCPSSDPRRCENATRLMFTALSISSMHISTVIMLRRMITPTRPMAKIVPESSRYASVVGGTSGTHRLLDFLLRLDALEDVVGIRFLFVRGQLALADDDRADHRHEQEERRDFERHEVVGVERHADRFGVAGALVPRDVARHDTAVGMMHALRDVLRRRLQTEVRIRRRIVVRAVANERQEDDEESEADCEAALPECRQHFLVRQHLDVDEHDDEEEEH